MDPFKDTHRYALELLKASRTMPVDIAEKQPHIRQIRTSYQSEALKNRTNKNIS
tara:strand:+ start:122 stop:283 length:162 start_codon:yes stop_codon:yes gene_type:complete